MRMNQRRTILLSAILFSVSAVADPVLPGAPAEYPSSPAIDHNVGSRAEKERADMLQVTPATPGEAPLLLRAETMLKPAEDAPGRRDDANRGDANRGDARAEHTTPEGAQFTTLREGKLQKWVAVESHQLDDLRGGFDTSLHLTLSFGIERAVYLNGALVTTTSFNLPALHGAGTDDMVAMAGNAEAVPGMPSSTVALIQNGPNNHVANAASSLPLATTVIQNTLSNQTIQNITTINASANSLQLLRADAFQNLLRDGISHGIGGH